MTEKSYIPIKPDPFLKEWRKLLICAWEKAVNAQSLLRPSSLDIAWVDEPLREENSVAFEFGKALEGPLRAVVYAYVKEDGLSAQALARFTRRHADHQPGLEFRDFAVEFFESEAEVIAQQMANWVLRFHQTAFSTTDSDTMLHEVTTQVQRKVPRIGLSLPRPRTVREDLVHSPNSTRKQGGTYVDDPLPQRLMKHEVVQFAEKDLTSVSMLLPKSFVTFLNEEAAKQDIPVDALAGNMLLNMRVCDVLVIAESMGKQKRQLDENRKD